MLDCLSKAQTIVTRCFVHHLLWYFHSIFRDCHYLPYKDRCLLQNPLRLYLINLGNALSILLYRLKLSHLD